MIKFVNKLYKNQALFYKIFLFVISAVLIVYMLPKGGKFKYEIPKGKPWQHENLYAPFDFAIQKTEEELNSEREAIKRDHIPYFQYNQAIPPTVKTAATSELNEVFADSILSVYQNQFSNFVQGDRKSVV